MDTVYFCHSGLQTLDTVLQLSHHTEEFIVFHSVFNITEKNCCTKEHGLENVV